MNEESSPELMRSIVADLLKDDGIEEVGVEEPLANVVDSFAMIELLSVLEERFGVRFNNDDLTEENWKSFATVASLIGNLAKR